MLYSDSDGPTRNHAPNQAGAFSEPVLAMFPKIVADPAMISALTAHWFQQKQAMKAAGGVLSNQWKDPEKIREAFYFVVHRMWLASCAKASQLPIGRTGETYDQTMERAENIKNIFYTSSADILKDADGEEDEGHLYTPFNTREVAFRFRA